VCLRIFWVCFFWVSSPSAEGQKLINFLKNILEFLLLHRLNFYFIFLNFFCPFSVNLSCLKFYLPQHNCWHDVRMALWHIMVIDYCITMSLQHHMSIQSFTWC
jgi:hypothetical protein